MRLLVACDHCRRRYDASDRNPGSRFHCHCGAVLTVSEQAGIEASIDNCAACGAPRSSNQAPNCSHCGSAFTRVTAGGRTVCPGCHTRNEDQAHYCHHCGENLRVDSVASTLSDLPCPGCGREHLLSTRPLTPAGPLIDECERFAVLWLTPQTFDRLIDQAQSRPPPPTTTAAATSSHQSPPRPTQSGPLYRPCPQCGDLMNRRNYAGASWVVIDQCKEHGAWFDADELATIIRWVEDGGITRASRIKNENDRHQRQMKPARTTMAPQRRTGSGGADASELFDLFEILDIAASLFGSLFKR
ncbi:MAG: TFIIB-type zinc ribbon-containing protein [Planctomycetota bacterium]|jgi:Zn-finger nucleic acid-binding protein